MTTDELITEIIGTIEWQMCGYNDRPITYRGLIKLLETIRENEKRGDTMVKGVFGKSKKKNENIRPNSH